MMYEPEHFIIMKLEKEYKVLGGWTGSYSHPDKWRLNSGIVNYAKEKEGMYLFYGASGSVYKINEKREGLSFPMTNIHRKLLELGFEDVPLKVLKRNLYPSFINMIVD
ncbi:MAG: hypothetical protein JKY12_00610 [Sneathiella sp.]|nr:hypothetical protein [Sneathiella sp.]